MKYEKGICNKCSENRIIVNKRHGLCNKCNKIRLQGQYKPVERVNPKSDTLHPKRYKIDPRSVPRTLDEGKYRMVKAKKREDMINGGYYKCFFTNKPIKPEDEERGMIGWHHVLGRTGRLLWDYRNIFPAFNDYHFRYTHESVSVLIKEKWYKDFVDRLRTLNHKAYNLEMNKWFKAGLLDEESFIKILK